MFIVTDENGKISNMPELLNYIKECTQPYYLENLRKSAENFNDLPNVLKLERYISERLKFLRNTPEAQLTKQETIVLSKSEIDEVLKAANQDYSLTRTQELKIQQEIKKSLSIKLPETAVSNNVATVTVKLLLYCLFITLMGCALLALLFRR